MLDIYLKLKIAVWVICIVLAIIALVAWIISEFKR